jgi:hypothetical protein
MGIMQRGLVCLPWLGVGLLLTAALPLFLCLPLWADTTHYDLCARALLAGGVLYRDIFDMNLPGMVWVHAAVRSLVGWRSEALRALDVLVVAGLVGLVVRWLRRAGVARVVPAWTVLALFAFYFSLTEWCHCQRDTWMLLPALLALHLRNRQLDRLASPQPPAVALVLGSLLEGSLWGVGIWIKPFVLLPCLSCWLLGVLMLRRTAGVRLLADGVGLLAGGLLAGALGCLWLWHSGALPYMGHIFATWNHEYYLHSPGTLERTRLAYRALTPWGWLHLLALPCALGDIGRAFRRPGLAAERARLLLAGFYLAWLVQAVYFQQPFDYVLAPVAFLAIALVAEQDWLPARSQLSWCGLAVFALLVLHHYPLLQEGRLRLWARCWQEGSSPALRDQLRLVRDANSPGWTELSAVAQELRRRGVQDGELTCFHNSPQPLYLDLGLRPSSPFLHYGTLLLFFPSHEREIRQVLQASGQLYVVSDLLAAGLRPAQVAQASNPPDALPPEFPAALRELFPWTQPVVFRVGRYVVHAVHGPVGPMTIPTAPFQETRPFRSHHRAIPHSVTRRAGR